MGVHPDHRRPDDANDDLVAAIGKASEAFEYIIRARGHLYSFHQLIGRADFLLGDAAELLERAGRPDEAAHLRADIVGRNVLDGRWTFQVVEEFDDLYYTCVDEALNALVERHLGGVRHVYEAELKEQRRTPGHLGHESRPQAAHSPLVDVKIDRA